ncbi:MAG: hypothetical protein QM734_00415 [Cyclobacteriaceae bacterium]
MQWDNKGQYHISQELEDGINADVLQYDYTNPTITLTSVLQSSITEAGGHTHLIARSIIFIKLPLADLF